MYLQIDLRVTYFLSLNIQEFMVQLLEDERKKAAAFSFAATSHQVTGDSDSSKALLANPVVFLRKWVGEVSVSFVDVK